MDADAGPAARAGDDGAGLGECGEGAVGVAVEEHLPRARGHEETGARGRLLSAEDPERLVEVFESAVCAGAEKDLVDFDVFGNDLSDGSGVVDEMRTRYGRLQVGDVELEQALIFGVVVGADLFPVLFSVVGFQEVPGRLVRGEDAGFGAALDGHIGDGEPSGHGEVCHGLSQEFDGPVGGAVGADGTDEVEHEILRGAEVRHSAGGQHLPCLGDHHPGLTEGHGDGDVGGSHSGGESAERASGDGMGVGADDHVTGADVFLAGDIVGDAAAYVGENGAGALAEIAKKGVVVGELGAGTGTGVIQERDGPLGRGEFFQSHLGHLSHGERSGTVLHVRQIDAQRRELVRFHVFPSVCGEDFLRDGFTHVQSPIGLLTFQQAASFAAGRFYYRGVVCLCQGRRGARMGSG